MLKVKVSTAPVSKSVSKFSLAEQYVARCYGSDAYFLERISNDYATLYYEDPMTGTCYNRGRHYIDDDGTISKA